MRPTGIDTRIDTHGGSIRPGVNSSDRSREASLRLVEFSESPACTFDVLKMDSSRHRLIILSSSGKDNSGLRFLHELMYYRCLSKTFNL